MKSGFPSTGRTVLAVMIRPRLLFRGIKCIMVILNKFFLFQFRSVLFPGVPVSRVEDPLDEKIPFNPGFIHIYMDFVSFWIRITGFLAVRYGKRGRELAADFIASITRLYTFAFQVYRKNLSTTARPRYTRGLFRIIHLTDPHLMCIPSLHVMLVFHAASAFRRCLQVLGDGENPLGDKAFRGALCVTEAVLYVKQHSVNCVAAAFYALLRFDPGLFGEADVEAAAGGLFADPAGREIPAGYAPWYRGELAGAAGVPLLRNHILSCFRGFAKDKREDWSEPLLEFLSSRQVR